MREQQSILSVAVIMKAVPLVVVLVVAGSALVAGQLFGGLLDLNSLDFNSFDFSGFDPTPFLRNREFMRRQLACVTRTGPCDFIGRQLTGDELVLTSDSLGESEY